MKSNPKPRTYRMVGSRQVFIVSLIAIALTIVLVFLQGLPAHRSFFNNAILTTTILSAAFFSFITLGLYYGVKIKDEIGSVFSSVKAVKMPWDITPPSLDNASPIDSMDLGEGIAGCIFGILLWLFIGIILAIMFWITANALIFAVLILTAMLYWIFFRALRLVFKHSAKCKDDPAACVRMGATYTLLYNFWIYGVFFLAHYLQHG